MFTRWIHVITRLQCKKYVSSHPFPSILLLSAVHIRSLKTKFYHKRTPSEWELTVHRDQANAKIEARIPFNNHSLNSWISSKNGVHRELKVTIFLTPLFHSITHSRNHHRTSQIPCHSIYFPNLLCIMILSVPRYIYLLGHRLLPFLKVYASRYLVIPHSLRMSESSLSLLHYWLPHAFTFSGV